MPISKIQQIDKTIFKEKSLQKKEKN